MSRPFGLKQTDIQRVIMALLGFKAHYVSIVGSQRARDGGPYQELLWRDLLSTADGASGGIIDVGRAPAFVRQMIARFPDLPR